MNRRERLRRCYYNEELDRPAFFCRSSFPARDISYDPLKQYLETYTELKHTWRAEELDEPYPVTTTYEPYSEDFKRCIEVLHTPAGDLKRTHFVSLKDHPGLHETYFINSREDAEKYLSLPMPRLNEDITSFFEQDQKMGDKGIIDIRLGFNPGGFVVELCGSETFAMMSVIDRDILHALCERQMKIILNRGKRLIEKGACPFFSLCGEEYLVPPLHGPKDFQDFNVQYDKPIVDLIHNANGRVHIHSHGSIKNVFPGFLEIGMDVLHPFEPPPMGDITAKEAKALARNRFCLEGNIQIHQMYESSPDEIRDYTRTLIQDVFDDHKGLIVCPTASPYIRDKGMDCLPQFQAAVETVSEYT